MESHRAGGRVRAANFDDDWWLLPAKEIVSKFSNHAAAAHTMKTSPKTIYLFLSSEKDFTAFCRILTKTPKRLATIDSIGVPVFSMLSANLP